MLSMGLLCYLCIQPEGLACQTGLLCGQLQSPARGVDYCAPCLASDAMSCWDGGSGSGWDMSGQPGGVWPCLQVLVEQDCGTYFFSGYKRTLGVVLQKYNVSLSLYVTFFPSLSLNYLIR